MINKKLVRHGNSSALVLDKTILQLLGIDNKTILELRIEGDTLIIKRAHSKKEKKRTISKDKKLQKAYEEIMDEYSEVFEKLAKN